MARVFDKVARTTDLGKQVARLVYNLMLLPDLRELTRPVPTWLARRRRLKDSGLPSAGLSTPARGIAREVGAGRIGGWTMELMYWESHAC